VVSAMMHPALNTPKIPLKFRIPSPAVPELNGGNYATRLQISSVKVRGEFSRPIGTTLPDSNTSGPKNTAVLLPSNGIDQYPEATIKRNAPIMPSYPENDNTDPVPVMFLLASPAVPEL